MENAEEKDDFPARKRNELDNQNSLTRSFTFLFLISNYHFFVVDWKYNSSNQDIDTRRRQ